MMTDVEKTCNCKPKSEKRESFIKQFWRPAAAIIFLIIVLFDFLIMPSIYEYYKHRQDFAEAISLTLQYKDPAAQLKALEFITTRDMWQPLTLEGGGMFFVAFGAILTGAAVTRGIEKTERERNRNGIGPV